MLLAAGGAMGAACLVRSNPQFLVVLLVPALVLSLRGVSTRPLRRAVGLVVLFLLGQTVVMSPWLVWQRQLGAQGVFGAPVVYYGFLDGIKRHGGNPVSEWVEEHYGELDQSFSTVVEINLTWLKQDPAALARLYAAKFVRSWYLSDSGRWDTAILLLHAPIWILALIGLTIWLRRAPNDPSLLLILAVIGYMWTVSAILSGLARYSSPLYGLLGLLACVPLVTTRSRCQENGSR